jgi:hypothetical protein
VKQHNEKLEALEQLDNEEERPDAHLRVKGRGRCRPGLKAVNGTCVGKEAPITLTLLPNVSEALNKLQNRLLNRRGAK